MSTSRSNLSVNTDRLQAVLAGSLRGYDLPLSLPIRHLQVNCDSTLKMSEIHGAVQTRYLHRSVLSTPLFGFRLDVDLIVVESDDQLEFSVLAVGAHPLNEVRGDDRCEVNALGMVRCSLVCPC